MEDSVMTIERVGKREFVRNIYKYLKEGEYHVVTSGKLEYVVTIRGVGSVVTDNDRVIRTKEDAKELVKSGVWAHEDEEALEMYACGCKKEEGKLCKRHGRY